MSDDEQLRLSPGTIKVALGVVIAMVVLTAVTIGAYQYSKRRTGTVVLPGGVTYLGPSNEQKTPTAPLRFTISPSTPWKDFGGNKYPYAFSYPQTLSLVVFPGDVMDSVAISWGNISPQENILLSVDNLTTNQTMKPFAQAASKRTYVQNWWKQFGGLKGVASITDFVNAKGLKGYKTKYINTAGQTPNDDVFFEVPKHPELVIRVANGILDPSVFDRIVDSVAWNQPSPTSAPSKE